jgi:hypothetical protein
MRTCRQFARLKADRERDIAYLRGHAERHGDKPSGRASASSVEGAKYSMARALSAHVQKCPVCG